LVDGRDLGHDDPESVVNTPSGAVGVRKENCSAHRVESLIRRAPNYGGYPQRAVALVSDNSIQCVGTNHSKDVGRTVGKCWLVATRSLGWKPTGAVRLDDDIIHKIQPSGREFGGHADRLVAINPPPYQNRAMALKCRGQLAAVASHYYLCITVLVSIHPGGGG
tara:strand:+ start:1941 stop:2432 length:492 start_codon:yes stop_codon:yes gene_type:complete